MIKMIDQMTVTGVMDHGLFLRESLNGGLQDPAEGFDLGLRIAFLDSLLSWMDASHFHLNVN
jgi:hypothetical protein